MLTTRAKYCDQHVRMSLCLFVRSRISTRAQPVLKHSIVPKQNWQCC